MELSKFLEKFLPDYHNRYFSAIYNEEIVELQFYVQNFPEALQSFADKICEKQRKNCWKPMIKGVTDEKYANFLFDEVLNAEQPKIEDL